MKRTAPTALTARRLKAAVGLLLALGAVAFALLPTFDGPDEASAAPNNSPIGHVYRSVSVERDGVPDPLFVGSTVWLTVEHGSLGVYGGCNTLQGGLLLTASRIGFSSGGILETAVGCEPAELEQRDQALGSFFGNSPKWRMNVGQLVLTGGPTTFRFDRDDFPTPLSRTNPASAKDLTSAAVGKGEFQEWPQSLGASWSGPFVTVDVVRRKGRHVLTVRGRCRQLEAPITIRSATLAVAKARVAKTRCRRSGNDQFLDSVRPFFGGTVMWHLDRGVLTLQRHRSTLTLQAR